MNRPPATIASIARAPGPARPIGGFPQNVVSANKSGPSGVSSSSAPLPPSLDQISPMFRIDRLDWRPTRDQGQIVSLSVGSSVLLIGTSSNYIIRWNLESDSFEELQISKRLDEKIHKVFIDPRGFHSLISMDSGTNYYLSNKWNKAHSLGKLKGVVIESIAWNPLGNSDSSTKKILIGTNRGAIYETIIEDKEKYVKKLYELVDSEASGMGLAGSAGSSAGSRDQSGSSNLTLSAVNPIFGLRIELFPSSVGGSMAAAAGTSGSASSAGSDSDPPNAKYLVMACTPTRQYQFIGGPTFEALFSRYSLNPAFTELPGHLNYSELRFFSRFQSRTNALTTSDTCAWLTGAGIFFGNLVFGSQEQPGDHVLDGGKLLAYPSDSKSGDAQIPLSLVLTEFHFLLLCRQKLLAINQLSEEIVYEEELPVADCGVLMGLSPDPRAESIWLFSDKYIFEIEIDREDRTVWSLYLSEGKFEQALEYCETNEQKELVRTAQADYAFGQRNYELAAKLYAKTGRSFEEIALKFVNIAANKDGSENGADSSSYGDDSAASAVSSASPSSLFSSHYPPASNPESRQPLKLYLIHSLEQLNPQALTQQTMICTWLTELFLENLNEMQERVHSLESQLNALESQGIANGAAAPAGSSSFSPFQPIESAESREHRGNSYDYSLNSLNSQLNLTVSHYTSEIAEFRDFLTDYSDCLNRETTVSLISSHGRVEELLFYAELIRDLEWVLNSHIQEGKFHLALQLLAKIKEPQKHLDLFYRFAPSLMAHLPGETVNLLIPLKWLEPLKLIPALMREQLGTGNGNEDSLQTQPESIRYLEYCVKNRNCREPAIHNYLLSLYARLNDEIPLLRFIEASKSAPAFDESYALRVCHSRGRMKACVALYSALNRWEEAVDLALSIDLSIAKRVILQAKKPSNGKPIEESSQKRLWLKIARYIVEKSGEIRSALHLLQECDGILKLDDLLPLFPDFVRIGEFKEEICRALDEYNHEIDSLKVEMEDLTEEANNIRSEIHSLKHRIGQVNYQQKCDGCGQPVLLREFFLFPCTHSFHQDCAEKQYRQFFALNPAMKVEWYEKAKEEMELERESGNGPNNAKTSNQGGNKAGAGLYTEPEILHCLAGLECSLCGSLMIESVSQPFVVPTSKDDQIAIKQWKI